MIWEKVRRAWTCMCARQLARRSAYILLFNIDSACRLRSKWQLAVFARVTVCTMSGGSYQNVLPCNLLSAVLYYKIPCFSFFHFFSLLCKSPDRQLTAMRTHCNEIALYWQAYISVRMCPCITARAQAAFSPGNSLFACAYKTLEFGAVQAAPHRFEPAVICCCQRPTTRLPITRKYSQSQANCARLRVGVKCYCCFPSLFFL